MVKKNSVLYFLLVFSFLTNCETTKNQVFFEQGSQKIEEAENRYDIDNNIYKVNNTYLYKFLIYKNDKKLNSDIKFIRMKIVGGTKPFSNFDPSYSQTVIQYEYLSADNSVLFSEKTGLVENEKNIWLHPPRTHDAGILQLSAFPYIKLSKTKKWKWNLGASYENHQNLNLIHNYSKEVNVTFEKLNCTKIDALTQSESGTTTSNFLFNRTRGFVFMEFNNTDDTKIILELVFD